MRKLTILCTVLALLVGALAGTALAKGGFKAKTFNFEGDVVSTSTTSVVVDVVKGNGAARQFEGQQKTFVVSASTRVDREDVRILPTDLVAGEEVRVQSKAPAGSTDNFPARKISAKDDGGTTGGTTNETTDGTTEDNGGAN
jgi:hypothetical protein